MTAGALQESVTMSAALAVVLGAVVAYLQFRSQVRHTRQERTLHLDQAIDSLNSTRMHIERHLPRTLGGVDAPRVRGVTKFVGEGDFEVLLRAFLARLEIFSLAVLAGVADEDFAFELLGSTVVWYGVGYRSYIEQIRTENHQPELYDDLTFLAGSWERRLLIELRAFEATGKPFFARSRWERRAMLRGRSAAPQPAPPPANP